MLISFYDALNVPQQHLAVTVLVLFVVFVLRFFIFRRIHNSKHLDRDSRRILRIKLSTYITITLVIALGVLWAAEIRSFVYSFVAISVAIVIAGKEVIECSLAFFYKATAGVARIGDRIEIHGLRGDVLFSDLLSTTLLEIGPGEKSHQYTGRAIIIPNSYFIRHRTINERFLKEYVLHIFSIPIRMESNIEKAKEILTEVTQAECEPYMDKAINHINRLQAKREVVAPDPQPRIFMNFAAADSLEFMIRIAVPSSEKGEIENKITCEFIKRRAEWFTK